MGRVDRREGFANGFVAGHVGEALAGGVFIGDADQQVAVPIAPMGEGVGFVDHDVLKSAVAQGIAFFHCVEPSDHTLTTGGGPELEFF